ncbi:uncharacterized protein LOC118470693 [Amphiprion ocellaris]|uniref:uncharacterized protein LOC118470693 n=1 Tax=Amphiprion ocellaris TaxID=80972 RepID=UPI00241174CD|nr:uncharacterized protein LOC118470693 [Amphiprion ocellaris]
MVAVSHVEEDEDEEEEDEEEEEEEEEEELHVSEVRTDVQLDLWPSVQIQEVLASFLSHLLSCLLQQEHTSSPTTHLKHCKTTLDFTMGCKRLKHINGDTG